ncbi:MAG: hypothetical protein ABI460_08510 [Caldimonas sp.]
MPLPTLHRLLNSLLPSAPRAETCPPLLRPYRSPWVRRLGFDRARREALAAARIDFVEAIRDLRTPAALDTKSSIVVARSMHELWHFRGQVFGLIACRHNQAEAARRVAKLDCHFARRPRRSGANAPTNPLLGDQSA